MLHGHASRFTVFHTFYVVAVTSWTLVRNVGVGAQAWNSASLPTGTRTSSVDAVARNCSTYCPSGHCSCFHLVHGLYVSCRLTDAVSLDLGQHPECVKYLRLEYNVSDHQMPLLFFRSPFRNLTRLASLDLRINVFSGDCDSSAIIFSEDAFVGLELVERLRLSPCQLYCQSPVEFQQGSLGPLHSLQHLQLISDCQNIDGVAVSYADDADLSKVTQFTVDIGLWSNVSAMAESMASLVTLNLVSSICGQHRWWFLCRTTLTTGSFRHLRHSKIKLLRMRSCGIRQMDGEEFRYVQRVESLDIGNNPIRNEELFLLTAGLHHIQKLTQLSMKDVYTRASPYIYNLESIITQHLASRRDLEILEVNRVQFEMEVSELFRRNLPHLSMLSIVSTIFYTEKINDIFSHPSISVLNVSASFLQTGGVITQNITFTPSLRVLDASHCSIAVMFGLSVHLHQNVEKLFLGGTGFISYGYVSLRCDTVSSLEFVDLSGVTVGDGIRRVEFLHTGCSFPRLAVLLLAHGNLGQFLTARANRHLLATMTNLSRLDLTNSSLGRLDPDVLARQTRLTSLSLAKNNLSELRLSVQQMAHLYWLDLSGNKLACLSVATARSLDLIRSRHALALDVTGMILACDCSCFHFINWLNTTKVHIFKRESLLCAWNSHIVPISPEVARSLNYECLDYDWLVDPMALAISLMLLMTLCSLVFRYRYILAYLWLKLRIRAKRHLTAGERFTYDCFVCYNKADYHWVRYSLYRNLEEKENRFRLCFHHRDFPPGVAIIDNIIEALEKSRYVILVVSRNSVASGWWRFELNMAHQMSLERQHNMIICIFLEEIPTETLPPPIGRIIRLFTCLRWPEHPQRTNLFWLKLQNALTHHVDL